MAKKILIIEDEADQVMMLQERLEASGYKMMSAMDGETGLKKAIEEKPDLILLDVIMPVINGYDVCKRLKANIKTKSIPIVILTASGEEELENKCLDAGAEYCLFKPYDSQFLLKKIKDILKE